MSAVEKIRENPVEEFLRTDRLPHVWCPGCGIGTTVNCFARAVKDCGIPLNDLAIVSGIGCTGRVAGYLKLDSFHTTHGRAIPFATGLKLANPKLHVVVYSGDGDLVGIGGNHFIHAARRNIDITVILLDNFTYAMTGGQVTPTAPLESIETTTPYGVFEENFNLPHLAASCGAVYVARWTAYHVVQVKKAMVEALNKKGFSFIEILSPCPTIYLRRNRLGASVNELKFYKEHCVIQHGADTKDVGINIKRPDKIIVGKFVDVERPDYLTAMNNQLSKVLGDKYTRWGE